MYWTTPPSDPAVLLVTGASTFISYPYLSANIYVCLTKSKILTAPMNG